MKGKFVFLVVTGCLSLGLNLDAVSASARGGLTPQDLYGVYVQDAMLNTDKLSETVTLIDLSCMIPPPPVSRKSGDGPVPIHWLCGGDGTYQLELDLKNPSDRRIHQLVLAAQSSWSSMNFMFSAGGSVSEADLTPEEILVVTTPVTSRGHLQVNELDNVAIGSIRYDVTKDAASVSLSTAPVCDDQGPVVAGKAPARCGDGSPAMSIALDLTAESDNRSFGVFLSAYTGAALIDVTFSATGDLTSIDFPSAFVLNGVNCYPSTYYSPVTSYRRAGAAWVPVTAYRASSFVSCPQHASR
jgi:hypothetical protein